MQGLDASRAPVSGTYPVLTGTQAPLPGLVAALIGLAALAVVMIPLLWSLARHLDTMAHEGAHAATGSLLGFPLLGVELNPDATGSTSFTGGGGGLRFIITGVAGYLGPSAFGLCAAKLIATGHVIAVLWVAVILLVLLLFLARKSFGIVSVPVAIALLAIVMRYAHDGLEEVIAYAITWMLLLSGVRVAVTHGTRAWDAWILNALTGVPRRFWAVLWLAGTLLAVAIGGKWLVLRS
jgi:hypothetical protein